MMHTEKQARLAAFRNEMIDVLSRHYGDLPAEHMLAATAYLIGQMIAMQDQRRFTAAQVMGIVSQNIEAGNRTALEDIFQNIAGNA